jgi:DNA-binding NtrC family response regulator
MAAIFEDRPCVLVVEDEPLLAMMAHDLVEEAGFRAVTAGSVKEALQKLERRSDLVVLFTDVDLPDGGSGLALAAQVRDRWPQLAVLVTSGKVRVRTEDLPKRGAFLPKPYSADMVRKALEALTSH